MAGITRMTDITALDCIGVPVYSAFRAKVACPERGNLSVYNGKALSRRLAKLGAAMEAIERYCAERDFASLQTKIASMARLRADGARFVSPADLYFPRRRGFSSKDPLEWVLAREILSGKSILIPAWTVICPYSPPDGVTVFQGGTAVGLAANFSRSAALVSALLETVEHDATSAAEKRGKGVTVDFYGMTDSRLTPLLRKLRQAGLNLVVKDVTGRTGIPTFTASLDDSLTRNPVLLCAGDAAHWDPKTAMAKAILEAIQSRLTAIQGAREDLVGEKYKENLDYAEAVAAMPHWFKPGKVSRLAADYPDVRFRNDAGALRFLLSRLKKAGFDRVIAVDLSRKGMRSKVMRAVVPGLKRAVY